MTHDVTWAHWNGHVQPLSDVRIGIEDRCFYFGDGIYEVIRVYNGRDFLLNEHMNRLMDGLQKMNLSFDPASLPELIKSIIALNKIGSGYVYLQVSRGTAPREHRYPADVPCNLLVYAKPLPADPYSTHRTGGARAITVPDIRWKRRDIKSVNLLGNCMAKQAAVAAGCQEAIQIEDDQTVTEGSTSNVFIVKDNVLMTPPKTNLILAGVTRDLVLRLARAQNILARELSITKKDLLNADEVFVTSTTAEILSISQLDETFFSPARRPMTDLLYEAFQKQICG